MISSHRIGPAPFISVNECGAGEPEFLCMVLVATNVLDNEH